MRRSASPSARRQNEDEGSEMKSEEETRETMSARLVEAAEKGQANEVSKLLKHPLVDSSFAVNRDDWGARTALRGAAENGHVEVVQVLLQDGRVDPAADESVSLWRSALMGRFDVVETLLRDRRADPAARDNWAVRGAAHNGFTEATRLLLKDVRVDPCADQNRAVIWAAQKGHVEIVHLLLQDPRVDGTRAIPYALRRIVPLLIEDESCGMCVNRGLFEDHHRWAVEKYDQQCGEKEERICAALWCMKEIGMGWADLRAPTGERMGKVKLDWKMWL